MDIEKQEQAQRLYGTTKRNLETSFDYSLNGILSLKGKQALSVLHSKVIERYYHTGDTRIEVPLLDLQKFFEYKGKDGYQFLEVLAEVKNGLKEYARANLDEKGFSYEINGFRFLLFPINIITNESDEYWFFEMSQTYIEQYLLNIKEHPVDKIVDTKKGVVTNTVIMNLDCEISLRSNQTALKLYRLLKGNKCFIDNYENFKTKLEQTTRRQRQNSAFSKCLGRAINTINKKTDLTITQEPRVDKFGRIWIYTEADSSKVFDDDKGAIL